MIEGPPRIIMGILLWLALLSDLFGGIFSTIGRWLVDATIYVLVYGIGGLLLYRFLQLLVHFMLPFLDDK